MGHSLYIRQMKGCNTYFSPVQLQNFERLLLAHMRLSDLIESYYSNLTDQVETDSHQNHIRFTLDELSKHLTFGYRLDHFLDFTVTTQACEIDKITFF